MNNTITNLIGAAIMSGYIIFGIGGLYWLWMSFQIGSFWMFAFGIFPPTGVIAAIVGAYSVFYDLPNWVYNFFS